MQQFVFCDVWQLLKFDSIAQHPWMLCAPLEVMDRAAFPDGKAAGTGLFIYLFWGEVGVGICSIPA